MLSEESLSPGRSPWLMLIILGGYVLASLFAFNLIGLVVVIPFFDFSFEEAIRVISEPQFYPESKIPLLLIQGVTAVGTFILIPWIFVRQHSFGHFSDFFTTVRSNLPILLTVLIMFSFMIANSIVIEWNMGITLPDSLSWFENWARAKEDQLAEITQHLTQFDRLSHFFLALLIIAVIPGIGEELLFRGLIQNIFFKGLKNPHIAIWVTAFLFATFHMQFYGLIPRMLLGALFGYMYYWSGHLGYSMIAHFVNNGFMLTMIYLRDRELIEYDIEAMDTSPNLYVVSVFVIVTAGLLFTFFRYFKSVNNNGGVAESV